jgi:hypothetical protein
MFESLNEQIRHDDAVENSPKQRIVEGVVIAALSILLFSGLYFAVRMLG